MRASIAILSLGGGLALVAGQSLVIGLGVLFALVGLFLILVGALGRVPGSPDGRVGGDPE